MFHVKLISTLVNSRPMKDAPRPFVFDAPPEPRDDFGIGARVRKLREERGWSLTDLAGRMGTTAGQITKLQNGDLQISLLWMRRFARAFGIKMGALLPPDEMDLSRSDEAAELLEIFYGVPEAERPALLRAAVAVIRAARTIAAEGQGAPVLTGNPDLAAKVSAAWGRWSESDRKRAAEVLDALDKIAVTSLPGNVG